VVSNCRPVNRRFVGAQNSRTNAHARMEEAIGDRLLVRAARLLADTPNEIDVFRIGARAGWDASDAVRWGVDEEAGRSGVARVTERAFWDDRVLRGSALGIGVECAPALHAAASAAFAAGAQGREATDGEAASGAITSDDAAAVLLACNPFHTTAWHARKAALLRTLALPACAAGPARATAVRRELGFVCLVLARHRKSGEQCGGGRGRGGGRGLGVRWVTWRLRDHCVLQRGRLGLGDDVPTMGGGGGGSSVQSLA
jgi:hypothetical protein